MTRERRLVLSLDEISGLRWQCNKCDAALVYQMDQSIILTQTCACGAALMDGSSVDEFQQMQAFVGALKTALRAHRSEKIGATLTLEFIDEQR
jgi:hypothetical protein